MSFEHFTINFLSFWHILNLNVSRICTRNNSGSKTFFRWWSWHVLKRMVKTKTLKNFFQKIRLHHMCWKIRLHHMCCDFKFCVISRLYFWSFILCIWFVKVILDNNFWNFMWSQASYVLTSRHMNTNIIVLHICQFNKGRRV
jgi:hypothetical protein